MSIWIRKEHGHLIHNVLTGSTNDVGKQPNITLGVSMQIADTNVCFLNTLLKPGPNHCSERHAFLESVLETHNFGVVGKEVKLHDTVIWAGHFNSYLEDVPSIRSKDVHSKVQFSKFFVLDELHGVVGKKIMKGFSEFPISWAPTSDYNMSDSTLILDGEFPPSYTDRVFYMGSNVEPVYYLSIPRITTSPHQAVTFIANVELVKEDWRHMTKSLAGEVHNKGRRPSLTGTLGNFIHSIFGTGKSTKEKESDTHLSTTKLEHRSSSESINTTIKRSRRKSDGPSGAHLGRLDRSDSDPGILFSSLDLRYFDLTHMEDLGGDERIGKYRVVHLPSKHEFIVHVIDRSDSFKYGLYSLKMNMNSPFLEKCVKILEDTSKAYCFMDDLEMIDLKSHLLKGQSIGENAARFYAAQILLSLKDLHAQGVAHMGVRAANVKIVKNGYLRLCGLVTQAALPEHSSPEILAGEPITRAADFWALGILIYKLLSGAVHPYFVDGMNPTELEIEKVIQSVVNLKFPPDWKSSAKNIITALLTCDPNKRLGTKGVQEVMSHPWFAKTDWKAIAEQKMTPPWMPGAKKTRDFDTEELFLSTPVPIVSVVSPRASSGDEFPPQERVQTTPIPRSRRKSDVSIEITETFDTFSFGSSDEPTDKIVDPEEDKKLEIMRQAQRRPSVSLQDEPKRMQILKELYTTEKAYVAGLNVLIQDFYNPLKEIVSKDIHSKIFMSFAPIVAVNGFFVEQLRLSIQNFKNYDDIAEVLIKNIQAFKLYVEYIANYQIAVQTVQEEKKKNSKFETFLSKKYAELNRRGLAIYDILSYLILPIQRLPRYRMLFEDLLKNTPEDEREVMIKVVEQMKQVVAYCNDKQKEIDDQNRVFTLQQKYKIPHAPDTIVIEKSQTESVKIILNQKGAAFEPDSLVFFRNVIAVEKGKEITLFKLGKDSVFLGEETPNEISHSFMLSHGKETITFHFDSADVWTKWKIKWKQFGLPTPVIKVTQATE